MVRKGSPVRVRHPIAQPIGCLYALRMEDEQQLRTLYVAFNARDVEAVLARTADDVDWPNAWEGGRVCGHAAVRDYWTRQWAEIDPYVEPVGFATLPDG